MTKKPEIGKMNTLKCLRQVDFGVYLDGGDLGEILLPAQYVPETLQPGDPIEVFLYLDSEDRLVATTEAPYAMVGDFAVLNVVSVEAVGAFLNWGLPKDLLVPFREQKQRMQPERSYLVRVYLDEKSRRMVASTKLDRFLDKEPVHYQVGETVDLVIAEQTDIGYKAIINGAHWGILYKNEVFQTLRTGQKIRGFIKKLRQDGKIDLTLDKPGHNKVDDLAVRILNKLDERGGFLALNDESAPEEIYQLFGVSKKTFKKAIGALYKKRMIRIGDQGIKRV